MPRRHVLQWREDAIRRLPFVVHLDSSRVRNPLEVVIRPILADHHSHAHLAAPSAWVMSISARSHYDVTELRHEGLILPDRVTHLAAVDDPPLVEVVVQMRVTGCTAGRRYHRHSVSCVLDQHPRFRNRCVLPAGPFDLRQHLAAVHNGIGPQRVDDLCAADMPRVDLRHCRLHRGHKSEPSVKWNPRRCAER